MHDALFLLKNCKNCPARTPPPIENSWIRHCTLYTTHNLNNDVSLLVLRVIFKF